MKKITETKTENYYCITEAEARYLHRFLGEFSNNDIAKHLGVEVKSLLDENGDTLHYYLWKKLDKEFKDKE